MTSTWNFPEEAVTIFVAQCESCEEEAEVTPIGIPETINICADCLHMSDLNSVRFH